MGPEDLRRTIDGIRDSSDPRLLYGLGMGDDAGVFKIREDLAIAQSIDLFTPVADDPYTYGRIAAANSLSDLYAIGARPVTAMNILACSLDTGTMREILRGGADGVREAGAAIVGGHTIRDKEPKYGLAVTGVVDPSKMVTNRGAKPGDALILTKKIGTGIIVNAAKAGGDSPEKAPGVLPGVYQEAMRSMMRLNRHASEAMLESGARACTDITGFGLLGHARNIAEASQVRLVIEYSRVPKFDGVEKIAMEGTRGGGERNHAGVLEALDIAAGVGQEEVMVLCDPQTSGGLLISVDGAKAQALLAGLRDGGDEASSIVGYVEDGFAGGVKVLP